VGFSCGAHSPILVPPKQRQQEDTAAYILEQAVSPVSSAGAITVQCIVLVAEDVVRQHLQWTETLHDALKRVASMCGGRYAGWQAIIVG
jgi:hypothetical protein